MNKKEKVLKFYDQNKRLPSYAEMATMFGYKSKNSVYRLVEKWSQEGWLKKEDGWILPGRTFKGVRKLGTVEAGFPTPAEEELADTITLDEYLIKNRQATFMLKVSGESMVEAGIMPDDMVLVERNKTPKNGDIVVAEVDGQWTIKYFYKKNNKLELRPANKKFKVVIAKEEMTIAAVAVAVVRKY